MEYYIYIKAVHIIGLVSWMAMLFYLPRLFVYHSQFINKAEYVEVVKIQERKLYAIIGQPAMIITFSSGIAMILLSPEMLKVSSSGLWLHIKILCAILLLIYHIVCGYFIRIFAQGKTPPTHKFFRFFNELPTIFLIIIAILAVCKPF